MAASDPFGDIFGDRFARPEPVEKGVQIRGREIDGAYYVRAEDVVGLLEVKKVLPKVTQLLKSKLRGA